VAKIKFSVPVGYQTPLMQPMARFLETELPRLPKIMTKDNKDKSQNIIAPKAYVWLLFEKLFVL
jgi:hypothetical protein